MRDIHRLRALRRARNLDPLSLLAIAQKIGPLKKIANDLQKAPQSFNQIGEAAQTIKDARLAERIGTTSEEISQTARWIKYAAVGGLVVGGLAVLQRARSSHQPTKAIQ